MQAIFTQLNDQPWFVDSDRDTVERVLASPLVANESFVVRPCASRKAVAISYKVQRSSSSSSNDAAHDAAEIVHTRVRLDAQRQMWSVDNTTRSYPTVSKLVASLRLKPLAKPLPICVLVDVEPLKRTGDWLVLDCKATVRDLLDHAVSQRWHDLAREAIALHMPGSDRALVESAQIAGLMATPSTVFAIKAAAPIVTKHYDKLPVLTDDANVADAISKPLYDIIPDLKTAIDRVDVQKEEARRRPQLPVKESAATEPEPARESTVRVVSGAFFDDLLGDLAALDFGDDAGAPAALPTAKRDVIQTKKLNTLFDLIDEEEDAKDER